MSPATATKLGVVSALLVLGADQGSKYWVLHVLDLPDLRQVVVLPVLNLTMVWNRGVTFGLLNGFGQWGSVQAFDRLNLDGLLALWHPSSGS